MFHFNSAKTQQAFVAACSVNPQFLQKCFSLVERYSQNEPHYLHLIGDRDDGYFDFGVFRAEVETFEYSDTTILKPYQPDRKDLRIAGGFVRYSDGSWGSHT